MSTFQKKIATNTIYIVFVASSTLYYSCGNNANGGSPGLFKQTENNTQANQSTAAEQYVVQATGQSLRGRKSPGTNEDNVVFLLEKGTILEMLEETTIASGETWYKVKYASKEGWISSKFATKYKKGESPESTVREVQIKDMKVASYDCGDYCQISFIDLATGKVEPFMFWSENGVLKELVWDDDGTIEPKYKGKTFEVTLMKKYHEWMDPVEMKTQKEWVWYVAEMRPK